MMAKAIQCPFMLVDYSDKKGELHISCEHGKIIFKNKKKLREHLNRYCGCTEGWHECTLAKSLIEYYEGNEDK